MNDFTITIDCENAAWFDAPQDQLRDVLDQIAAKAMDLACGSKLVLRDFNGNATGLLTVSPLNGAF